ncbi:MAG: TadE family protein [Terriglobia bacterium]
MTKGRENALALQMVLRKFRLGDFLRQECGSEIVEVAAVIPLLLLLLIGIFWFGRAYNIYETINRAAREGARVAVAPTCAECGNSTASAAQVQAAVNGALSSSGLNPSQVQSFQFLTTQSLNESGSCPAAQSPTTPPQVCGVVVSFSYPFSFRLPFTTVNAVTLSTSAQIPEEY